MPVVSSSIVGAHDDVSLIRINSSTRNGSINSSTRNGSNDVKSSATKADEYTDDDSNKEAACNNSSNWLRQAAELLNSQWPKGGSVDAYKDKCINEHPISNRQQSDDESSSPSVFYGLPSSYLLIHENECIGHGRLTECFESAGGNAAAVTFIVIHSTKQYHGFGRKLMALLEEEAKRLGYHYIYLWTKTAIGFYEKIGYAECQRVSLKRACLKKLVSGEVESLEALLMKRQSKINMALNGTNSTSTAGEKCSARAVFGTKKETILLPPDDNDRNNDVPDVWMKKRLVERVGSIHIPLDQRMLELEKVADESTTEGQNKDNDNSCWYYRIVSIPWQAQIGPSCGLAALRMGREYFMASANNGSPSDGDQQQLPSLLQEAQERGFTQDGEIFDANHLKEMAIHVCGIDSEIVKVPELTPSKVNATLAKGGVFILPYDSSARTRLPAKLSGQSAHYGIIVGIALVADSFIAAKDDKTMGKLQPLVPEKEKLLDGDRRKVYLMVQHGLSPNLSIAPWIAFMESNAQLIGFDESKFGTAKLDLKGRIVVCRGLLES
ncbi:unnamed protein product [Cylindrotheca closterium]|uniref:Actin maturation protease n=1 Tax=Cylindrotheca closterium TaxID=2856 RepID=A0AAD2CCU4_9STRA|nr:unnamed protein product [Cylindrotheca closterium]